MFIPSTAKRSSRGMSAGRKAALQNALPHYEITVERAREYLRQDAQPVWLEIGFGAGEHVLHRAAENPGVRLIGCEMHREGLAVCASTAAARNLSNLRLFADDARLLLQALPEASLERVFILFPDPWPKTRHHKRRLVNQDTLALLARALRPGGSLHLATDHPGYAAWMLTHIRHHGVFSWLAERKSDWETPPAGHAQTRYERKRKAGFAPVFLNFKRAQLTDLA